MADQTQSLDEVMALAANLSPLDKVRLLERLASTLERDLTGSKPTPKRSLLGLCADLGPAPSAEDIAEARRQMMKNFPREDIA